MAMALASSLLEPPKTRLNGKGVDDEMSDDA
jgi:hypothetical protein